MSQRDLRSMKRGPRVHGTREGVALVTGAASGIGAAMTELLLRRGWRVMAQDLSEDALRRRLGDSPSLLLRALDVRDRPATYAAVTELVTRHGALDLAVHNAGVVAGGAFEGQSPEATDRVLDVNLRGVLHGTEAAYAQMLRQGHGQILNVASMAGIHPVPYSAAYSASKHAVVGLTLSLRAEAADRGVGVSVVCPGVVDTGIFAASKDAPGYDYPDVIARVPGRKLRPDDAAAAMLDGARHDAAYVVFPASSRALRAMYRAAPGVLTEMIGRMMRP